MTDLISRANMADLMMSNWNADVSERLGARWRRVETIVARQGNLVVEGSQRLDFHMVERCLSGAHDLQTRSALEAGDRPRRDRLLLGGVSFVQNGVEFEQECVGTARIQQVYIDRSVVDEVAAATRLGDPGNVELLGFQGRFEPRLTALCDALLEEGRRPAMGTDLFAEAIAQQIALLLLRRRDEEAMRAPRRRCLSKEELSCVIEHMEADLADVGGLDTLGGTVGMDPFSFTRAFREATGQTPHQFLIGRRIERAKALLLEGQESIAAIAYATGFSSQSHMTTVFGKRVGTSPARWRAAVRD